MTFKSVTRYFCQNYCPYKPLGKGKLMRHGLDFAYVNPEGTEYAKLPRWLSATLEGKAKITHVVGPFIFFNGFEDSPEGKYLRKIFPYYFRMSEATMAKVNGILHTYEWWVRTHAEYVEAMIKVELK